MKKYDLMRMCENLDEDGLDYDDLLELLRKEDSEGFKEKYKSFYSDIKLSIKEDW